MRRCWAHNNTTPPQCNLSDEIEKDEKKLANMKKKDEAMMMLFVGSATDQCTHMKENKRKEEKRKIKDGLKTCPVFLFTSRALVQVDSYILADKNNYNSIMIFALLCIITFHLLEDSLHPSPSSICPGNMFLYFFIKKGT